MPLHVPSYEFSTPYPVVVHEEVYFFLSKAFHPLP